MKKVLLLSLLTLVLCVFGPVNNALAQIPRVISYQAEMLDENGNPLNTTVGMVFSIYDQQTGGTKVWTEPQDVPVVNGFMNVYLGSVQPLDLNFDKPYWLEVSIANSAFPRTRLASVPYALNTLRATFADSSRIASTVIDSAITQSKLAAGVQALPWGNAGGDLAGTYPNPTLRPGVVVENIKPGSITLDKLSPGITLPPGGPASGDLTGNYPDPLIAPGAVKTDRIFNGAVTTEKIADNSIINSKINADAVTTDKIMNGTILVEDLNAASFGKFDQDSTNDITVGTLAGGDLTGTYPDPTVKGIQGFPVDVPTVNGGVLTYNDATKTYSWVLPMDSVVTSSPIVGNGTAANPVTLFTDGVNEYDVLFFDGNDWVHDLVSTANLKDGAVTNEKIENGAITTEKISSDNEPASSLLLADGNGGVYWSNQALLFPHNITGDVTIDGNLAVSQDITADNVNVTSALTVDGTADVMDLSAITAQFDTLNVINTITGSKLTLSDSLTGTDATFNYVDVSGTVSADFGVFQLGAQSPVAPTANEDLTNKAYVDAQIGTVATDVTDLQTALAGEALLRAAGDSTLSATGVALLSAEATLRATADSTETAQRIAATTGDALITAINDVATTGTIAANRITLPANVALKDANNTFSTDANGDIIAVTALNTSGTVTGSAILASSNRSTTTIQASNDYSSATAGDGMAGAFYVGGTNATVANALYARNYSNGNAFVAQADGTGYAIEVPDAGGRIKLSAEAGLGPVPANVSVYSFESGAATFTISGGALGQVVYCINNTGGDITVYGHTITDQKTGVFMHNGTTWVPLDLD